MPKLLVFQHVASEPLGDLDPLLRESGRRIRYVNFGREPDAQPDIRRYDGLVVLGGPMNVDQVERFPHLGPKSSHPRGGEGAEARARHLPRWPAAGGGDGRPGAAECGSRNRLVPAAYASAGAWRPAVPPFRADAALRLPVACVQVRAATEAVPLAWTRSCRQQAYRLGDHAWGLQFHLEADAALIDRWLHLPNGRSEIERHWSPARIARIQAATHRHLPVAGPLSERVFGEFIQLFAPRRYAHLPSR